MRNTFWILMLLLTQACVRSQQKTEILVPGFRATGNEPFWMLEIDPNNKMHFKTADGFALITPVPTPLKPQEPGVERYRAATSTGTLQVTIFRKPCEDTMSGKISPYTVQVKVDAPGLKQALPFEGCGRYLGQ